MYKQRVAALQHSVEETYQQLEKIHTTVQVQGYLAHKNHPLGTYSSICLGSYGGPKGVGRFIMSEVPLSRSPPARD